VPFEATWNSAAISVVKWTICNMWAGKLYGFGNCSHYSDSLRTGRYGGSIPGRGTFPAPFQAHLVSRTMGNGSFSQW